MTGVQSCALPICLSEYGNRGVPLAVRAFAAFSWALLIGAILPRQLPALLVSGCIAVAVGFALPAAFPYGDGWRWIPVAELSDPSTQHASRFGSSGFLDRNGAVLTYREALAAAKWMPLMERRAREGIQSDNGPRTPRPGGPRWRIAAQDRPTVADGRSRMTSERRYQECRARRRPSARGISSTATNR